ncbi:MAG: RNA polymerase sigma factor RpoD/SigA [Candidatus Tectomicrobia bacterium]|nr:RNA polymerase sigma factor RpoD/SigA [Candidatus Tectomicrobia bacterium]
MNGMTDKVDRLEGSPELDEVGTIAPDALSAYLATIREIPVLDRERECKVIRRAKKGDRKSWDLFIRSNLRYVVSVANRYKGCGVSMADLIHEGNIGLIEAAKRFDPDRGVRFITYAVWWIRQAMVHTIASQGGAVHLSVKQAQKRLKVREIIREMEQASGEEPSVEDLAEAMDELPEEVVMLKAAREALSLDAPLGDADSINHVDLLTDGNDHPAEERLNRVAVSNQLLAALGTLPKREGEILRMRYGFAGEPMTLQEIGEQMNLSRERIRQLEKQALRRLRGHGRMAMLRDVLN